MGANQSKIMNMNTLSKSVRNEIKAMHKNTVQPAPVGLIVTVVATVAGIIVTAITVFGVSIN
jgi:hypothetical protein